MYVLILEILSSLYSGSGYLVSLSQIQITFPHQQQGSVQDVVKMPPLASVHGSPDGQLRPMLTPPDTLFAPLSFIQQPMLPSHYPVVCDHTPRV